MPLMVKWLIIKISFKWFDWSKPSIIRKSCSAWQNKSPREKNAAPDLLCLRAQILRPLILIFIAKFVSILPFYLDLNFIPPNGVYQGRNYYFLILNSQAVDLDSWVQSALKSIIRGTLFLNRLHDFSLLSSNLFLYPFLKSKFTKKKFFDTKKIAFICPKS